MPPLLELKDIMLASQDYVVLERASVTFAKGASSVIMGPSGCGKSTLLKVAAGICVPDSGEVLLEGRPLQRLGEARLREWRRSSGFMFQDAALWANKSIFENLALPLQFHHPDLPPAAVRERVRASLERGGLEGSLELRPAQLSMGENKIASFLRAVILEPDLLFLDEPTTSIDHDAQERMMAMIREMKQRGCTIISVTHDAHLASMLANDLVVLKQGRVLAAADLATVRRSSDPEVLRVLSQVLSEAAAYDTDLLDLLGG
jgi:ABC-type transporter Mla maintaining outer membrane lipid asymmetry ATPase subunit MlaF